jgi:hypothetical protein
MRAGTRGRARWLANTRFAVGEFHRIARAPTSWRTLSKGFPRGRLKEFLAFLPRLQELADPSGDQLACEEWDIAMMRMIAAA